MTKQKTAEEKQDLEKLLESLQEKFGEGAVMKLGDVKKVDVAVVGFGFRSGRFSERKNY